ncbi:MAG: flavin reductase [Lachnospiraceae bacterium]|nr:flavin reductase [Lachnospiraceae bacterium]
MHVFQPYPIESLEFNVFTRLKDDWGVITAESEGKVNAMTASWGTVGYLWNKNVVVIYVRRSRYTHEFLENSDFFSLSFFDMSNKENRMALKILGSVSGRNEDKIAGVRFNVNHKKNIPFIDEANFVFLCHKLAKIPMDDPSYFLDKSIMKNYEDGDYHDIYIGEVMEVMAR